MGFPLVSKEGMNRRIFMEERKLHMGENLNKSKSSRMRFRTMVLLGGLAFFVISGLDRITLATSNKYQGQTSSGQVCYLNPFDCTLVNFKTSGQTSGSSYGKNSMAASCFTKYRCLPCCRTPYRPPWWWYRSFWRYRWRYPRPYFRWRWW